MTDVVFEEELLLKDPALEWVTPGHPLFEAVREDLLSDAARDLQLGCVLYDQHASAPYRLDFFAASVKDVRDSRTHRRLFAVQTEQSGQMSIKEPKVLLDLVVAAPGSEAGILPALQEGTGILHTASSEQGPAGILPVASRKAGKMPAPHFKPLRKEAEIHIHRRRLPHWEQDGCTYFVTFRLADSLPVEKLKVWQEQKAIWLKHHPQPWSDRTAEEYNERFVDQMQEWLDAGHGSCALQGTEVRTVVENALRHFDGERYALDAFVVMPNHVHLLVQPMPGFSLSGILHSWKSYTSNVINKKLGRSGPLWLDENFDHAVRALSHLNRFRQYIASNPAQAHLRPGSFVLSCGAGIQPALEDSPTWRPPAQVQESRQDACSTCPDRQDAGLAGGRQDACSTCPETQAALNRMLGEVTGQRTRETQAITRRLENSLNEVINRQQLRLPKLAEMQGRGDTSQPLAANTKQTEDRLEEFNACLEDSRAERERECMISDMRHIARAWVLPPPER